MMMNMTEADYESWRDDLRCGGQEEQQDRGHGGGRGPGHGALQDAEQHRPRVRGHRWKAGDPVAADDVLVEFQ